MRKYLFFLSILLVSGFCLALVAKAETVPVITLAKLDTPDPVAAGANLTYTLNFTISDADATGVVMTDEIPTNTSFVSASDPGQYDPLTNKVTWNYGDLKIGINEVVQLKVKVYSPLPNKTVITNTAAIDSIETEPLSDSEETTVSTAPILKMEKLVDKATANAGETINYTIKLTNSGTDTAHNAKLTDTLPAGFIFDNGTYTMAYSFGNIEAGKTVATTYAVKIDAGTAAGAYTNKAEVTADNHTKISDSLDVNITMPKVLGEEVVAEPAPQEEVKPLGSEEEIKVLGAEEELVATGGGLLLIISGLVLAGTGLFLRKKVK